TANKPRPCPFTESEQLRRVRESEIPIVVYKVGECMQELIKLWKEYESSQPDKSGDFANNGPTLEVQIPAEYVTATNRRVRGGQLWGTDIYTDDSDLVAVLMHTGYCRPTASPPPPTLQELRATIRVLPSQDYYTSKLRNNVRSRSWGAGIGCSYKVERCYILKKGGGTIELEPSLTHSSEPTLAPMAVDKSMTTRAAASNAQRQQMFVREVTIQYNLCNEPWIKYSISAVADKGLKKPLFTSARLKKGEVLYLETHSSRYELCFAGEKTMKAFQASQQQHSSSEEATEMDNNNNSVMFSLNVFRWLRWRKPLPHVTTDGEKTDTDSDNSVIDVFRWSRCKKPLPQKLMRSIGFPLPPDHVEVLEENLDWEDVQWSQTGVWIAGKEMMSGDADDDDDELSSGGSGDEVHVINGHNKRIPTAPSGGSGPSRRRNRKAGGVAIVEAMLELAAASKMRAAALTKKNGDNSQDSSTSSIDLDIELDEMELVAAAAGYLYYQSLVNQPPGTLPSTRGTYLKDLLQGPVEDCREVLRMDKRLFHKLSDTFREQGLLRDTITVLVEEQVAIFLSIIGHNQRIRVIQERFHLSCETISRHFNNVLKAVKAVSRRFFQPPVLETHEDIVSSKRLYPYFKDCIGVIDGLKLLANLPIKDQPRFQNKKGILTQNVLVACNFDLEFIFVCPGWEGSINDSRILRAVLDDPNQNFPQPPKGKYYLVDRNYTNTEGFIAPYQGARYGPHEYHGARQMPQNAHDLFNHRHMCLSNVIQRSVSMLKTRFPILKSAPPYHFQVQRDLVIATCALHNFIKREDGAHDWLFAGEGKDAAAAAAAEEEPRGEGEEEELELLHMDSTPRELVADSLRDSIAFTMWDDFMNKWEEW
ncbi:unnamed protein product, partial [Brassica rapa subsp. trilocularis]